MNTCSECEWWKPNPGTCEQDNRYCPAATAACKWFEPGPDEDARPPLLEWCEGCGGEGKLYTSRWGGNDPDVWPTGTCETCRGTGRMPVESEPADEEYAA